MRMLSWLVGLIVAIASLLFALDNREMVTLGFWPLPVEVRVPLFAAVLGGGLVGFLIGATMAWVTARRWRRLARRQGREIEAFARRVKQLEGAPPMANDPPRGRSGLPTLRLATSRDG
jgi:uncharacterized integral membrane protein